MKFLDEYYALLNATTTKSHYEYTILQADTSQI